MPITSTITLIELVWTVPALIGLLVTAWMVADIWGDWRYIERLHWNGLARFQVKRWLHSEIVVLAINALLALTGLVALTQPQPATSASPPSTVTLVIVGALVSVPALLMVRSIGDRYARHRIRREWRP